MKEIEILFQIVFLTQVAFETTLWNDFNLLVSEKIEIFFSNSNKNINNFSKRQTVEKLKTTFIKFCSKFEFG